MSARTITGEVAVLVNQYTPFDPSNPTKTAAHDFSFWRMGVIENGALKPSLAADGYAHVCYATIQIELLDREAMTAGAVAALRAEKQILLAKAEQEANRIEQRIQSLLALTLDEVAA